LIAVPLAPAPPALVRVQEGPAPVAVGPGLSAADRYVRLRLRFPRVDSHEWKSGFALNWIVGFYPTGNRVAFFVGSRYVGSDLDFGNIGRLGRLGRRSSAEATFAETLFRTQDQRCCPKGRTIDVKFRWNGRRLVATRPLLREGLEPAEGLQTPSRNIGCIFGRSPQYVRCDVRPGLRLPPPRPKNCDLDWAYGLEMTVTSRPHTFCAGDTVLAQGPVLAYGATLRILGFTCRSERIGLRCANRGEHGFFLARESWRVF
jgi:hypothetical protein